MSAEFGNQSKSYLSKILRSDLNSFKAFAYQQITVSGTVQGFTIPDGAKYALCVLESDATGIAARYLETLSTTVASGTGMPLLNMATFDITDAENLRQFQIIQEAAHTTKLNITYYK